MFIDVDDLKSVNDRLGHTEGDRLLREVVAGLQREMRTYDLIVRVGGDEFVCALAGVTAANARERCELVKADLRLSGAASSFSVGIGELIDTDAVSDLIARADRDLLRTRQGRT
jgi:diguanylate cyclase (GGDEF)-like protein